MELPALVTAVAENQIQGCRDCSQAGLIYYLGESEKVTVDVIVNALFAQLYNTN